MPQNRRELRDNVIERSQSHDKALLTPDQGAAHDFLCWLRSASILFQLPYQYGVEAQALETLWGVLGTDVRSTSESDQKAGVARLQLRVSFASSDASSSSAQ
jgi:hypothetical protein